MNLSAPIHVLKSKAKKLKKDQGLTQVESLTLVAKEEGFSSWSLLMSKNDEIMPTNYDDILEYFKPGDLVLIGARPTLGKTSFTIGLFVKQIEKKEQKSFFFTLSKTHKGLAGRISKYNEFIGYNEELFELDYSNDINAEYIIKRTKNEIKPGSIIVIDYLQMLDEKRVNPPLEVQVLKLKKFAKKTGAIVIFLSQIKRELEYQGLDKQEPDFSDIRLPNPLDLKLINKTIFIYKRMYENDKRVILFKKKNGIDHRFTLGWSSEKYRFYNL